MEREQCKLFLHACMCACKCLQCRFCCVAFLWCALLVIIVIVIFRYIADTCLSVGSCLNVFIMMIIIIIIHKFSIALFPAERAQRACSHTCT